MAIKLSSKPNTLAPSSEYPYGDIQDKITGVLPGTPVNRLVYSDIHQFFEKIFGILGKTHNGLADNNANGYELVDALLELIIRRINTFWTIRTSAADNAWYSVTYGNGLFVAVSATGTGNRVMTSI